jgi:hypothetical protein
MAFCFCAVIVSAVEILADVPDDRYFYALGMKESGNNPAPPVGDNGRAHGIYQIHPEYVADVNRHFGKHYRAEDCDSDPDLSREIVSLYFEIYATEKHLGHKPTAHDYSELHHAGPYGPFKDGAIDKYGHVPKDNDRREKIRRLQENAVEYAEDLDQYLN